MRRRHEGLTLKRLGAPGAFLNLILWFFLEAGDAIMPPGIRVIAFAFDKEFNLCALWRKSGGLRKDVNPNRINISWVRSERDVLAENAHCVSLRELPRYNKSKIRPTRFPRGSAKMLRNRRILAKEQDLRVR